MKRRMEQVDVYTNNGQIWIEQANHPEEAVSVVIEAGQVPLLVQWLQEAAAELSDIQKS